MQIMGRTRFGYGPQLSKGRECTSGSFTLPIAISDKFGYTTAHRSLPMFERLLMTRRQNDPLRPLTPDEQHWLDRISRSQSDPASHVARAKVLLAVAAGASYTAAARAGGRRSND